jgi:hypothetical protein
MEEKEKLLRDRERDAYNIMVHGTNQAQDKLSKD